MEKIKQRHEIEEKHKWDLSAVYADEAGWERDFAETEAGSEAFAGFSGKLGGAAPLLAALEEKDRLWQTAERIFVYARMRKDEDNRESRYQALADRAQSLMARVASRFSFFVPEILELPEATLRGFMDEEPKLRKYAHYFNTLLREKAHILSKPEESLIAQYSEVTGATNDIFSMINNADMKFGTVTDQNGEEAELTHGNYVLFLESPDRRTRKEAFEKMYGAYARQRNTLAATYSYNTKTDAVAARVRKYPSSLASALSGDNIPTAVYDNLIEAVGARLGALHRYMDVRRRLLGVDEVHMYDVYVPLFQREERHIPFEEALSVMKEGLAVLGDEYVSVIDEAVRERWLDVYENEGKTSGAYSFGSYDSRPYILMNYKGKLKDVFTLAHEMGHSMHSWHTRRNQPFIYGGHSIFTAEVASTVNEALLMRHLLERADSPSEKKYLLNLHIEEFRTTLFRQTMFAEFERLTHETVERGGALTADFLSEEYHKLNGKYFGEAVANDAEIAMEWARIPHFYRAFYVYKYATGYSAATAIAKGIAEGGAPARDAYIEFLKTGESDDPIELLKIAGIDMSRPEPVLQAMDRFEALVGELEAIS
ncbi:MAG: oligoendopeptidase F [Clostridiales Family XIII bacterium]|nr:oligoendopeptidase F [Clostridiales Family XIII bacterium]